ncbi:CapA family protein [Anaerocolumna sp. AGMB13020]|uniref:CapA family protein n=1 Tax=Anaerocolumna sp. AGMB13020 TaxID=3081750 RepID=UPI002955B032|nr:CapA family protein [Anaerocolumna sp. AGMB13020]WOO36574.1 CapA family protein [Anaerocolumna sp. AGMB13020]
MSKRRMYGLLAFIIFTFSLLAVVIIYEVGDFSWSKEGNNNSIVGDRNSGSVENTTPVPNPSEPEDSQVSEGSVTEVPKPTVTEEPWKDITMLFTGDIYLSDVVANTYKGKGIEAIVEKELLAEMQNADITMSNQEFAFSTGGTAAEDKQYTFRVNPDYITAFQDMGIDIVTLANNHTMDFGLTALEDSFDTLKGAGIDYVGAGSNLSDARKIHYTENQGKTIAFLAASRVIPVYEWNAAENKAGLFTTYDPTFLLEDIKTASENSDYVVVYLHWGIERAELPKDYQHSLAKQYIDAGADLVIGSHPHVLQGVEYYKGKPIIYSLGNYIFYSNIQRTAVLKITLDQDMNTKVQLLPAKAENARTKFLSDKEEISKFYQYMESISFGVGFDEAGYASELQ